MPTPFLRLVADCYVDNESDRLIDYCFVMPNKRSGAFLSRYFSEAFAEAGVEVAILPKIVTISDFVASFSESLEPSPIEQLFILYNVYSEILTAHMSPQERETGKSLVDFNKFQYWGDILLNDFNDVDRFLVDASQLFKNVVNLKEISANYLTPEQIDVIRRYWNEELVAEPVKEFWNHIVHVGDGRKADKKNVAGFLKLWQVMYEIYTEFRRRLRMRGMAYPGMSYRDALETIKGMAPEELPYSRYVFVGFNVLSTSEHAIFSQLQRMGAADFYWDYASPAFRIASGRGSRLIMRNVEDFPSLYDVMTGTLDGYYPDIEIVGLPSTFGQAKFIPSVLKELYPRFFSREDDMVPELSSLVNTAIVLPDEGMVQPVLGSMPREIPVVNVTMGYTLRHTPVASLLRNIISLQIRARDVKSASTFFYEDVIALLSHPLLRRYYPEICNDIVAAISSKRLFNIPADFFDDSVYEPLSPVFRIVSDDGDGRGVTRYLCAVLEWLEQLLIEGTAIDVSTGDESPEDWDNRRLDVQYVRGWREAVGRLADLAGEYLSGIYLDDKTVFHLVGRLAGNQTVGYEGVPLEGLQVMGVLETRCLDFDNLIVTSMNERIFPRKHYSKSFIPEALRRGYGMSTIEHQESMYAYYFYRMISRARRVWLLYDCRSAGVRSGTPSRFINQIRYWFPPEKVKLSTRSYPMIAPGGSTLCVDKTPAVMERLNLFRREGTGRFLSASSINDYITCPLKFYLTKVERYYEDDQLNDYMDESTFGTIVHDVAERMLVDLRGSASEVELTPAAMMRLADTRLINQYVEDSIRANYLKTPPGHEAPLTGDAAIYLKIMTRIVRRMFQREAEMSPGRFFVKGEDAFDLRLNVGDRHIVNFTCRIDRVDRITAPDGSSAVRLIDYKTGSDKTTATNLACLFDSSNQERPKAILQLMLYANAYARQYGETESIQPYVYLLRTVAINPFTPLKVGGHQLDDFRQINDEFIDRLSGLLDEMFDPGHPFVAIPSPKHCKYCHFSGICTARQ